MLQFIKKYKYLIITNLILVASYLLIATTPDLFGIDDTKANVYIFHPEFTFGQTINWILDRVVNWNSRIGELLYFTIGCFPRWVFFTFSSIFIILFFNLVYFYIYGKKFKEKVNTLSYFTTMMILLITTLTLYPAFSETIIWMAGVFNHLVDTTIVLVACIPFRLLFDKYNLFKEKPKLKIPFYILCIISGFSTEHLIPWFLLYIAVSTLFIYQYDKKIKWQIFGCLFVLISFICMYFLSSTQNRINFFYNLDWALTSKSNLYSLYMKYYISLYRAMGILFIVTFIFSLFDKNRKLFYKNFFLLFIQAIFSFVSMIVLLLAPYYAIRTTILTYFFQMTIIGYCFMYIIKNKIFLYLISIISIISVAFITIRIKGLYNDFNEFNKYRYKYLKEQVDSGKKHLRCPSYDNKYNVFFPVRLTSYECYWCDNTYVQYVFGIDDLTTEFTVDQIR